METGETRGKLMEKPGLVDDLEQDNKDFMAEITEPKHKIQEVRFYKPGQGGGNYQIKSRIGLGNTGIHLGGEVAVETMGKELKVGVGVYKGQKVLVLAEAKVSGEGLKVCQSNKKTKSGRVGNKRVVDYLKSKGLETGKYKVLKFKDCIVGVPE